MVPYQGGGFGVLTQVLKLICQCNLWTNQDQSTFQNDSDFRSFPKTQLSLGSGIQLTVTSNRFKIVHQDLWLRHTSGTWNRTRTGKWMGYYILCRTVHITPGQGMALDTIGFHTHFSFPVSVPRSGSVQCVMSLNTPVISLAVHSSLRLSVLNSPVRMKAHDLICHKFETHNVQETYKRKCVSQHHQTHIEDLQECFCYLYY